MLEEGGSALFIKHTHTVSKNQLEISYAMSPEEEESRERFSENREFIPLRDRD